jgi:GH15 family glucan-1,4-alpha-glucosidase
MTLPIEDYALIGNTRTAALVGKNGSIDWLCLPRFDAPACFAALLGSEQNGHWRIAPTGTVTNIRRRYHDETLVLETHFETETGAVAVIDFMPIHGFDRQVDVVRIVKGLRGEVDIRAELILRFDYGSVVPWVRRREYGLSAVAGPDAVRFQSPLPLDNRDFCTVSSATVSAGQVLPFRLTWFPSHQIGPVVADAEQDLADCEAWWHDWAAQCTYRGRWRDAVIRSLITLKALTYGPTGGIVAAVTTSLPEQLGGCRNWDYRYCWIRDAALTLDALASSGFLTEARAWRDWLLRAVAGRPSQLQIMYSVTGERRLPESILRWLDGYEGSRPVQVGNDAHGQLQLDIYGEMMDAFHQDRVHGLPPSGDAWQLQRVMMTSLEKQWRCEDHGLWEMRGQPRHFTHSKVMAWVAVDRAVKATEMFDLEGTADEWRQLRQQIHDDVCQHGFHSRRNAFVQYYGSDAVDASLLMIPLVGFLPADDPRVVGTVEAIQRDLHADGLIRRYESETGVDGLEGREGAFLACTFWFADALHLMGRRDEAEELFEKLLSLRNDVGLLAEEYDPREKRQLGNFPQAFSHVALINTANNILNEHGPARRRSADANRTAD